MSWRHGGYPNRDFECAEVTTARERAVAQWGFLVLDASNTTNESFIEFKRFEFLNQRVSSCLEVAKGPAPVAEKVHQTRGDVV
jgi:hypothetical protein